MGREGTGGGGRLWGGKAQEEEEGYGEGRHRRRRRVMGREGTGGGGGRLWVIAFFHLQP